VETCVKGYKLTGRLSFRKDHVNTPERRFGAKIGSCGHNYKLVAFFSGNLLNAIHSLEDLYAIYLRVSDKVHTMQVILYTVQGGTQIQH
jgi:hypothetical protein